MYRDRFMKNFRSDTFATLLKNHKTYRDTIVQVYCEIISSIITLKKFYVLTRNDELSLKQIHQAFLYVA